MPSGSIDGNIPYNLLFKESANIQHYRKFGCLVYNYVQKKFRTKFDSHIQKCIYLGPESDHGIHKLYNPETKRVFKSRNIKFFENENYPFKNETNNEKIIYLINNISEMPQTENYESQNQNQNMINKNTQDQSININLTDEINENNNPFYNNIIEEEDFEKVLANSKNFNVEIDDRYNPNNYNELSDDDLALL